MPYALDSQLLEALAEMRATGGGTRQPTARGDWKTLRERGDAGLAFAEAALPEVESVSRTDHFTTSHDGAEVLLRWYAPEGRDPSGSGPAAVYLHGGGMIAGSVALFDRWVAGYAAESGVPLLAVDYRRAPDHPHPTPVEDSHAGLAWLAENAEALGADPARIALMGDSAGGGLAAAAALLARDRGTPVAKQILIYPMLDDRTTEPDPALAPFVSFTYDENHTGWHALLGDAVGGPDVPGYAAPARAQDLTGLPPAYIEVGELDIFRDEDIEYAFRLAATGTSVELHVHPGCPHGFDRLAPHADVVRRSRADRLRVLTGF
ncbi:alpha/beta hydrolase [Streptomyces sp. NPDC048251]|uniref:alpha/beta hydrolase n=1 Tax=Streptomyces sp. NPDC048251 TaxID=3154501 RepID=UPI003425DE60